ncbi:copper resistance CopC family protein [Actinoplanes sp. NPDC051513]|uniref:copper resistance CopC family protein n=1 Tax=Actinoplanes sp. NPDC051513 TaxID=3363908 RepID=UPI0037AC5A13
MQLRPPGSGAGPLMSRPARLIAAGAVALAAGLVLAQVGRSTDPSRAAVTSTSPADGATLARAPAEVELSFTGPVDPAGSHVSALGPARNAGGLRSTTPERLSQPIVVPAAGEVTVAYHVILADGAELAGSLRFTVRSAGTAEAIGSGAIGSAGTAGDAPAPADVHAHGIDPVSAGLLVADGIAVLVVGALLLRRPRAPGGR